jgi:pyruvate dehydrogenase E1 component alpha subunit
MVPTLTPLKDGDLRLLLLIRYFELSLLDLFSKGKLNGTTHTCLGQEYIPVALRTSLIEQDFVFSNHRGHGHYLARYKDPAGLLAEIMGREGAICCGVGGSQHIYRDNYLSTGVQGESLSFAAGVALHLKRKKNGGMAVVFMGDGTWGEGAVYEALNIAQLWRLPLLAIVENNKISQSTPVTLQMAGTIEGRVKAFGIDYLKVTTMDINKIRSEIESASKQSRLTTSPLVIEFETVRLGPHSKGDDTRGEKELENLRKKDWLAIYRKLYPAQTERIELESKAEIARLIRDIQARPLSKWHP